MTTARFDQLIWVFIYGGMILCGIGLMEPLQGGGIGWLLLVAGAVLVMLGASMIWRRSRRGDADKPQP